MSNGSASKDPRDNLAHAYEQAVEHFGLHRWRTFTATAERWRVGLQRHCWALYEEARDIRTRGGDPQVARALERLAKDWLGDVMRVAR